MGIFLVFYKLLLERESMHHFKRFFLLTALIISLIIPQIVFTEYIEAEPTPAVTQVLTINEQPEITPIVHEMEESPMNWTLILYTLYGLGVAIFGFRFFYNIAKLWIRVRRNTQIKFNSLVKVLLKEELPPHTFLRYIFLNKQKFESKSIPAAVLLHEETHAKEWHSLDVLFIELLQVLFWFNPLIYVFKKSIKLNHEFLADSAVIKGQENQLNYQNTLLSYLSNDNFHTHQSVGIANAINYSSIKKRIIIMKKQTSKRGILIRSLLILPVLSLMLYGFSQRNVVSKNTIKDINIEITKSGDLLINNEPTTLENLSTEVDRVNHNFGPYITRNYITAHILYDETQNKLIGQIETKLGALGISNIKHFSKRTTNILGKNGFKPSEYHGKTIDEAKEIRKANVYNDLKTDIYHEPLLEIAWIEVKNENEIWFSDEHVQLSQLNEKVKEEFPLAVNNNKLSAQIYTTENIHSDFTDAIIQELRKLNTKSISVFIDQYIIHEDDSSNKLRSDNTFNTKANRIIKLAGLVIDSETLEPIINVEIKNYNGTVLTTTDNKGYYSLEFVNAQQGEIDFNLIVKKEGYKPLVQKEHWGNLSGEIKTSMYFGLQKNNGPTPEFSKLFTKNINLDYASIAQNISVIENEKFFTSKLEDVKKGNTNCIVEINKTPYLVSATSWIKLNSFNDVIAINDETNLPASKLNTYINRNNIKAMSPLESYDTAQYAIYTISGDINANLDKRAFGLYNRLAKKYNAIPINKRTIPLNDLKVLESIYRNMSDAEKKLADSFPKCLPKQSQDGASKEQLVYYNELAKKYNHMIADGGNIRILKSDVDQLKHIYGLMSKEQKEHAEPFPDFPEPPPAPKAPKAPNSSDYADNQIKEIIENQDPYDHLNLNVKSTNGIPSNTQTFYSKPSSPVAPTPPTPPSPLDYAIDMAKKGAIFYFEGEKITSDKAIDLLKKNNELNMESRKKLGKTEVRITTAPVTIR